MARKPRTKAVEEPKAPATSSKNVEAPVNAQEQPKETKKSAKVNADDKKALMEAISMYQNDTTINENITNDTLTEEQKKCVAALDKAMLPLAKAKLARVTIHAILDEYLKQVGVSDVKQLLGMRITNVPYMSTTKKPYEEVIKHRYDMGVGQPVCIVVHADERVKGLDVEIETEKEDKKKEIILARNQQFYVGKVVIAEGCGETYPVLHFYAV